MDPSIIESTENEIENLRDLIRIKENAIGLQVEDLKVQKDKLRIVEKGLVRMRKQYANTEQKEG
jgi:hypothetical protein